MPVENTMIIMLCAILFVAFIIIFVTGKVGAIKKWDAAIVFRRQMLGLYVVYIFTLLIITVLAREPRTDGLPNIFIPFYEYYFIIKNGLPWYYDNMILLNAVNFAMFIPYGVLSWEIMRGKIVLPVVTGIAVSLVIEILQLATGRGIFDVNDIMYNALGTLAGCGICAACRALWHRISNNG